MSVHYLNPQEVINKTVIFDEKLAASVASSFHVAYGIDKNFFSGCGVSITPVSLHNNGVSFVLRVFIDDVPEADIQRLAQLAKSYRTCIQIHLVNCKRLEASLTTKNWSIAMCFRLVIADYFIDQQDKVLYPDVDIACRGNLKSLITTDPANNVVVIVTEYDAGWWSLRGQSLQCNELEKGYFNSGVLLINTLAWAQEFVPTKAMSMLAGRTVVSRLAYMDQDTLNLILLEKAKFIDVKYNTQFSLNYELKKSFVYPIDGETVLTHYVGPTKPWHYWAGYPSAQPFIRARETSSWKNELLIWPVNSNCARYCAEHNFKRNKPTSGIMDHIYYFYLKIIK